MNERALCEIWNTLRFRRDGLADVTGQLLQLVYRGRWQHGPGPDFRGALIARADGLLLHGDVEVHLRTADWYAHHHDRDPAFADVILHVVLQHDAGVVTRRHDGSAVPVLALGDYLPPQGTPTPDEAAVAWPPEPCRTSPVDGERLGQLLDRLGDERLSERAAACESDLAALPVDEVLYRRLMDAMGYSQNRAPFRALAQLLPLCELAALARPLAPAEREEALAARLLAAAGLAGPGAAGRPGALLARERWRLAGVRPANQPERRLRGVAALLARYGEGGLARCLCLDWPPGSPRAACLALRRRLLVAAPAGMPGPRHLLGPGRAADVVVNVLLPFALAYADLHSRPTLAEAAWAAYRAHPRLAENELTRAMAVLLAGEPDPPAPAAADAVRPGADRPPFGGRAGPDRRRPPAHSARRQQGLLHLFHRYCDYRRCGECPAAPRNG